MLIPILSIAISFISCIISALTIYRRRADAKTSQAEFRTDFSVSNYLARTEKAYLQILEEQKPFEYELVLWWGLDGIRLNKDGTTEWISRKKKIESEPVPVTQIVAPMPRYPAWPCYNPLYNAATQINRMNLCNDTQASQNAMNWIQRSIIENQIQASQTRIAQLQQLNAMCQNTIRPSDAMNYLVTRQIEEFCCNMNINKK